MNQVNLNIINTNARSLRPKIVSLVDGMRELEATFAVVTETWFSADSRLELETENLLLGSGISVITRNRGLNDRGLAHGGVVLPAKDSLTKMKEYAFPNPESFEVLPVIASVDGMHRKNIFVCCYIPPGYAVPRARACMQLVNDIVLDAKDKLDEPYVCVHGDFNQWGIEEYLEDYPDVAEIITPLETRNMRRIDRVFCNWHENVTEKLCLPPLETEGDDTRCSDHLIQFVGATVPRKAPINWHTYSYRPITKSGSTSFRTELIDKDWSEVFGAVAPNSKEAVFQQILGDMVNRHFPSKTVRRKEGNLPLLDDSALKMIKKKWAIYKSEGRRKFNRS